MHATRKEGGGKHRYRQRKARMRVKGDERNSKTGIRRKRRQRISKAETETKKNFRREIESMGSSKRVATE